MGSFCKSGPSTTTSTSTTTPAGISQLNDIWSRVSAAASTPYQTYTGQQVADLNPTQQGGINNITNATSYLDTARDYATAGAQGITPDQIAQYYNPFQRDVVNATQANFNESNAQQDERQKGNSIASGAWGGDRAGVSRAILARQQDLAQAPVIAGLNSQGFNLALSAAQADRAAKAQGGYQFGALGNSAIGQGQAQIGAGSVQQGNDQAKLNAQYQEFMRQQAFPYQQAQFLSSAGLPAVTAMGGTTAGATSSQAAQPSPLSQIIGAGTAIAGLATGNPFAALGGLSSAAGGLSSSPGGYQANLNAPAYANPYGGSWYGNRGGRVPGYASGGRTKAKGFDHGGFIDRVHMIRQALRNGGPVIDMRRGNDGGYSMPGYADGGGIDTFGGRFGAADDAITDGTFDPQGANYYTPGSLEPVPPLAAPQGPTAIPVRPVQTSSFMRPISNQPTDGLPPQILNPGGGDAEAIELPDDASAYGSAPPTGGLRAPTGAPRLAPVQNDDSAQPFMPGRDDNAPSGPFNLSQDARMGLIAAGLGILGSKNPNALGAVGEGGLQGLKTYTEAKSNRQKNELDARKLIQQAEQFQQTLGQHKETLDETKRYHDILDQQRKDALGERRERSGYQRNPDGTMSPIKGGPADPEQISAVAKAKQTGGLLPDDTANWLADRVLQGDTKALIGLGRGAQGAENITKIQTLAARKAADQGLNPSDILARTAEQSGLTAQQRTFGTQVAKMAVNSTEAQGAIELGREASKAVPRTNWVPINKLIQAGQVITSDPKLIQFAAANLAIVNTYARAISPTGTPTVHDKEHAEKLLSTATGPEAYNALLDQLNKEIEIAHAAPMKAKREMEAIRTAPKTEGAPGAPPAVPPVATTPPPARPSSVPPGSAYSPSRKLWKTPDGKILDAAGNPVAP